MKNALVSVLVGIGRLLAIDVAAVLPDNLADRHNRADGHALRLRQVC